MYYKYYYENIDNKDINRIYYSIRYTQLIEFSSVDPFIFNISLFS